MNKITVTIVGVKDRRAAIFRLFAFLDVGLKTAKDIIDNQLPYKVLETNSIGDAASAQAFLEDAFDIRVDDPTRNAEIERPIPTPMTIEGAVDAICAAVADEYSIEEGNEQEFRARVRTVLKQLSESMICRA